MYIIQNKNRLFINTSLGCSAKCRYCYLPNIEIDNNIPEVKTKKAEEIINELANYHFNEKFLISLGCFSECWSNQCKKETLKILKFFLAKGNQVQLSTKKQIKAKDIKSIVKYIKYKGQLVIFISSSTISECSKIEVNTDSIAKRFKTFQLSKIYPIVTALYIKPVLKDITVKDINLYKDYIRKYEIDDVVVGSMLTCDMSKEKVAFSSKKPLYYNPNNDELIMCHSLKEVCNVFTRSTQVMNKYKQKEKSNS